MNIDPKSAKIIKTRYWRNGWVEEADRVLSATDAVHLSENGWDLGPIEMSHDALVREVIEMSEGIEIERCAAMLANSLASRQVQDRSFLSSALQALTVPDHSHSSTARCPVCGLPGTVTIDQDVMLFEKMMWGGVRLLDMCYVWLDLKLLSGCSDSIEGSEELRQLLERFSKGPRGLSASKTAASLKAVKGNKAEREILASILGICDVLQHPDHPGFLACYPSLDAREMPNQHFIDLEWPFCWYNSDYGVNLSSFELLTSPGANKSIERTRLHRATQL
ncbi:MAG: hypothetical protein ACO34E_09390 [Limisphaerales bacterium]